MVTGEGDINFDVNDENKTDSLYSAEWIPGVPSSAQRIPYIKTAYNPDTLQPSGAYWEPAAEIKWLKNSNNVLNQENTKLRLEIKVYKKIIKNLLKKK